MAPGLPPRWATWLLDQTLPEGVRGRSIHADLKEELREIAAKRGAAAARRWFGWEAVKLAAHYVIGAGRGPRGDGGMETILQNVRLALRRFRRAPSFTALAVLTLALGIGAAVAIFSVVDTVLLEPLPYREPERLVAVWEWNVARDRRTNVVNPGNFRAWRERTASFSAMSAVSMAQANTLTLDGEPAEVWVQYAQPDFFDVLGLDAAMGRTFAPDPAGEETEVVISHRLWRGRFGGDPGVVGRSLSMNGRAVVVVGVLPQAFVAFGDGTELWASLRMDSDAQAATGRWLMVVGRMADDVAFEAAYAELGAVMAGLREENPDRNAGWDVNPVPLKADIVGDVQRALWVLLGAVGLLLLIACANVANLFLLRSTERLKEMAVRTSLGASGRSLVGQLLVESLMVAGLGAALGVALAHAGTRIMAEGMPDAFALPRVEGAGVDGSVLLFAVAVSVVTGLLFGVLPAAQAASASPAATLGAEGRGPSRRSGRTRSLLVVAEVAVSVVLVSGALLFARSFTRLLAVDPGIEASQVLVGRVNPTGPAYADNDPARVALFEELERRIASRPGVLAVGGITFLPLDGMAAGTRFHRGDRPEPPAGESPSTIVLMVSGRYFDAMGMRLLQGRLLDERDRAGAPRVVVVSRALAETHFAGEDPLGKPIVVSWDGDEPWEIVGVVEDVRREGLDVVARETSYFAYAQLPSFGAQQIVVRAAGDPATLTETVRGDLADLDPAIPLGNPRVMTDIVRHAAARPRMTTFLMLLFAGCATALSAVGLYGVLAYTVSQRVREIGVRVAIGARPGDIVRMVMARGARLAAAGLVIGIVASLVAGRAVASLLYEVPPSDPLALGGAAAFLFAVAVAACALPAWRATRVAPVEALRAE